MATNPEEQIFAIKALESLDGANSELTYGRYNNCANRCYYACFQAAVAALLRTGIKPPGAGRQWSHAFVPAAFVRELIDRRKVYPSSFRDVLPRAYALREIADYRFGSVSRTQAARLLSQVRTYVRMIADTMREPS